MSAKAWEEQKERQKKQGLEWRCSGCQHSYGAASYFGMRTDFTAEQQRECITEGSWRCCISCQKTVGGTNLRKCSLCECERDTTAFAENSTHCLACTLQLPKELVVRTVCKKVTPLCKKRKEGETCPNVRETQTGSGEVVCFTCQPDLWTYQCVACGKQKPIDEFRDTRTELEKRGAKPRCKGCQTCATCGIYFTNFHLLAPYANRCTVCYSKEQKRKCAACKQVLPESDFPKSELHNRTNPRQNPYLRCTKCHTCDACEEKRRTCFRWICKDLHPL